MSEPENKYGCLFFRKYENNGSKIAVHPVKGGDPLYFCVASECVNYNPDGTILGFDDDIRNGRVPVFMKPCSSNAKVKDEDGHPRNKKGKKLNLESIEGVKG